MPPRREVAPASRRHELAPAPIEVARRLLARLHLGDVDDPPRHLEPLIFETVDRGAAPLLVIVGIAPRDRAAAGGMGVVPVFHVVLLGHPGRPGVADVVVAQELLDLARRLAVDEKPAPAFGLVRSAGMPHRHRPRLPRQQRRVRKYLARRTDETMQFAAPPPLFLFAMAEILGDDRR